MSGTTEFELTPSPADPQPVSPRCYAAFCDRPGNCDSRGRCTYPWESVEQCEAREEFARRIAAGEQFPQLFACTEY